MGLPLATRPLRRVIVATFDPISTPCVGWRGGGRGRSLPKRGGGEVADTPQCCFFGGLSPFASRSAASNAP